MVSILFMLRLLQLMAAVVMLLVALQWAVGDNTHQAWLAVLGFVLALLQLLEKRLCE